jgi:hypothetical protein
LLDILNRAVDRRQAAQGPDRSVWAIYLDGGSMREREEFIYSHEGQASILRYATAGGGAGGGGFVFARNSAYDWKHLYRGARAERDQSNLNTPGTPPNGGAPNQGASYVEQPSNLVSLGGLLIDTTSGQPLVHDPYVAVRPSRELTARSGLAVVAPRTLGGDYSSNDALGRVYQSFAGDIAWLGAFFGALPREVADEAIAVAKDPMRAAHTVLDAVGMVDPFGIADIANAGLYAAKGDWQNASISLAGAVIPYAGDALKLTRMGGMIVRSASGMMDVAAKRTGISRGLLCRAASGGVHAFSGGTAGAATGFVTGAINGYFEGRDVLDAGWDGARGGGLMGLAGGAARGTLTAYICFVAGTRVVVGIQNTDDASSDISADSSYTCSATEGGTATATRLRYRTVAIEDLVACGGGEGGGGADRSSSAAISTTPPVP